MSRAKPGVGHADYSETRFLKTTSPVANHGSRKLPGVADFSMSGNFLPVDFKCFRW
jgi:hypothetical protein